MAWRIFVVALPLSCGFEVEARWALSPRMVVNQVHIGSSYGYKTKCVPTKGRPRLRDKLDLLYKQNFEENLKKQLIFWNTRASALPEPRVQHRTLSRHLPHLSKAWRGEVLLDARSFSVQVCARRTDYEGDWSIHLKVTCQRRSPPSGARCFEGASRFANTGGQDHVGHGIGGHHGYPAGGA